MMSGTNDQNLKTNESAPAPDDSRKPQELSDVKPPTWGYVLKRSIAEFSWDKCTDLAATLTYFAVLSLFPGLLALVSLLGVFGQGEQTADAIVEWLQEYAPEELAGFLSGPVNSLTTQTGAGLALIVGLVGALWTASGYVTAFGRAMNAIYEVEEGRPVWKLRPVQLLLTFVMVCVVAIIVFSIALSGGLARAIGDTIGLGDTAVLVWNIAKWPVVVILAILLIGLLYYWTPNIKRAKFRWITVGSVVSLVVAALAVAGFTFYVANFSSYNATYGIIGSVIVLLLGLWIINNVLLFGAEIDAELERGRQLQGGVEAEDQIQLPLRDDHGIIKQQEKRSKLVSEARKLRSQVDTNPRDARQTEPGDSPDDPRRVA